MLSSWVAQQCDGCNSAWKPEFRVSLGSALTHNANNIRQEQPVENDVSGQPEEARCIWHASRDVASKLCTKLTICTWPYCHTYELPKLLPRAMRRTGLQILNTHVACSFLGADAKGR